MMSMHGPSNLSKALTSITAHPPKNKESDISGEFYKAIHNNNNNVWTECTKPTQAFDAPHSISWCSSGLVCDKRQLSKILAPRARGDIHLLFLMVFFRLLNTERKANDQMPLTIKVLVLFFIYLYLKIYGSKWDKHTLLLFMVILTWPDSTM